VSLVGRDAEVEMLRNAVDASVAHNRAQLVLLLGDAGVGKTRLAAEVAGWASCTHEAVAFEGRCVPYGEANVWWPVAEALRSACLVESTAPAGEARARALDRVAQAYGAPTNDAEVQRTTDGLMYVMGYEGEMGGIDPAATRDETVRSLTAFLEAATRHQPVIVQLSDLHWADEVVLDLLDTLLERLARAPFLLMATARPQLVERWSPGPGRYNLLVENLEPLDRQAAAELLTDLLGYEPSPKDRDTFLERSGGNPFFLEELVTLLDDRPAAGAPVELPATLRGLVAARIDALSAGERAVLQDASVLGRRAPIYALRTMSVELGHGADVDAELVTLVDKEILEVEDGMASFRSDLVREVTYGALTKNDRAKRHVGIADWLERHQEGEPSQADIDRLARHYGVAAELLGQLGRIDELPDDLCDRALHWIGEAATRAERTEVLPVAVRLYSQGLGLLPDEPSSRRLAFQLGRAYCRAESWDLGGARADLADAHAAALALGDRHAEARAMLISGDVAQKAGDLTLSVATLGEAAQRYEELGDQRGRAEALRQLGMAEMFGGHYEAASNSVSAARTAFLEVGDRRGEAWALQNLAWISFVTGQLDDAETRLRRSADTFSELDDRVGLAWARGLLGFVRLHQGDFDDAEALAEQVLPEARARGDRWATGMTLVLQASLRLWTGRTLSAIDLAEEAGAVFADIGDGFGECEAKLALGASEVLAGRIEDGFATLERAVGLESRITNHQARRLARAAMAGAAVQLGDPERAEEVLAKPGPPSGHPLPIADRDRATTAGLAAMQAGRVDAAREVLGESDASAGAYRASAWALLDAVEGRTDEAVELAKLTLGRPGATYLDDVRCSVAAGLAEIRRGDATTGSAWLRSARTRADVTEDVVTQAVARLAEATGLSVVGDPRADRVREDAQARLDALGITASGWHTLFGLAAGAAQPVG
jgi:tetratricopeptide (TPR) repeat protein